jgi:hypothetical protein
MLLTNSTRSALNRCETASPRAILIVSAQPARRLDWMICPTDSARLLTISPQGGNSFPLVRGVTIDHRNLWHHGKDAAKIARLQQIEET